MASSAVLIHTKTISGATGKNPQKTTSSSIKPPPAKRVRKLILPAEVEEVVEEE